MPTFDDAPFARRPVLFSASYGRGTLPPRLAYDFLAAHPAHREPCEAWARAADPDDGDAVVDAADIDAARRGRLAREGGAGRYGRYRESVASLTFADGRETPWPWWVRWPDGRVNDLRCLDARRREGADDAYARDMAEFLRGVDRDDLADDEDLGVGVAWVPECYDYRVHEYDGRESVSAQVPWERAARELAAAAAGRGGGDLCPAARFLAAHPDGEFDPSVERV